MGPDGAQVAAIFAVPAKSSSSRPFASPTSETNLHWIAHSSPECSLATRSIPVSMLGRSGHCSQSQTSAKRCFQSGSVSNHAFTIRSKTVPLSFSDAALAAIRSSKALSAPALGAGCSVPVVVTDSR